MNQISPVWQCVHRIQKDVIALKHCLDSLGNGIANTTYIEIIAINMRSVIISCYTKYQITHPNYLWVSRCQRQFQCQGVPAIRIQFSLRERSVKQNLRIRRTNQIRQQKAFPRTKGVYVTRHWYTSKYAYLTTYKQAANSSEHAHNPCGLSGLIELEGKWRKFTLRSEIFEFVLDFTVIRRLFLPW